MTGVSLNSGTGGIWDFDVGLSYRGKMYDLGRTYREKKVQRGPRFCRIGATQPKWKFF